MSVCKVYFQMATSKKKVSQDELRRLMNEQKKKFLSNVKKIESPLARYEKDGTLHCVICDTVVRSEAVWSVHLNSKNHKQNILNKIKKKDEPPKTNEVPKVPNFKRPIPDSPLPPPGPPKKVKGILKNSTSRLKASEDSFDIVSNASKVKLSLINDVNEDSDKELENEKDVQKQDVLPEGFFDDPKLDAKVRNVEYRDPIEEEWEHFQREIREETNKAQQIISEDQEEATAERQIDEIDEQIRNWSRVVNLEKKKEIVSMTVTPIKVEKEDDETLGDEEDFDEFLDWRSKKSFDYKLK